MSFKPIHRLEYIDIIKKFDIECETHLRCVIHQAYYAALNQIQYEIENRLFFPIDDDKLDSSHKVLIDAFHNQIRKLQSNDPRRKLLTTIVNNMKRAKRFRQIADYDFEICVEKVHVDATVKFSKEVFDCLEQYN